jgi:hypothetical protein
VPSLERFAVVAIVAAVEISYGRFDEFVDIDLVQSGHSNGVELAPQCRILTPSIRANAAMLAEQMVTVVGMIVRKVVIAT